MSNGMRKFWCSLGMVFGIIYFFGAVVLLCSGMMYEINGTPGVIFAIVLGIASLWLAIFCNNRYHGRRKSKNAEEPPFVNPYVDTTPYENLGSNEKIGFQPVNYPSLALSAGEVLYFACPANTFTQKEQVVGYSGGSGGVSVRIAKGLTYRTGSSKGAAIRQEVIKYNPGDYIVTNKRLVFIGIKDSFDIPVSKITAIKATHTDAFTILAGNKHKNIQIHESQAAYALGFSEQAVSEFSKTNQVAEEAQALLNKAMDAFKDMGIDISASE